MLHPNPCLSPWQKSLFCCVGGKSSCLEAKPLGPALYWWTCSGTSWCYKWIFLHLKRDDPCRHFHSGEWQPDLWGTATRSRSWCLQSTFAVAGRDRGLQNWTLVFTLLQGSGNVHFLKVYPTSLCSLFRLFSRHSVQPSEDICTSGNCKDCGTVPPGDVTGAACSLSGMCRSSVPLVLDPKAMGSFRAHLELHFRTASSGPLLFYLCYKCIRSQLFEVSFHIKKSYL